MNKEAANAAKALGNTAFSAGNFAEAAEHFSSAIAADPTDHIFFSNRRCVGDARCVAGARPARDGDSTGGSGSLPLSRLWSTSSASCPHRDTRPDSLTSFTAPACDAQRVLCVAEPVRARGGGAPPAPYTQRPLI